LTGLLDGAVVAVTGAASGIGRATALTAGREGAAGLVLSDRDTDGLASLTAELADAGTPALAVAGQITDPKLPGRIIAAATDSFGRLDAAVNNAGIRGSEATLDVSTDEAFDEVIDVNLRAMYRCLRAELQQMYTQGSGAIVNVGSASVFGVAPGLGPYIASKMGIIGLSKVAASEAGPHGVRVNVVAPGRTSTLLLAQHASSSVVGLHDTASLVAPIPLGRFGEPTELADVITYLCSPRASFVTGATLVVDGGRTG
jgi:NAD(P)-dependent dehydrogenase (short-subunit alcohol dehydrogenase family)